MGEFIYQTDRNVDVGFGRDVKGEVRGGTFICERGIDSFAELAYFLLKRLSLAQQSQNLYSGTEGFLAGHSSDQNHLVLMADDIESKFGVQVRIVFFPLQRFQVEAPNIVVEGLRIAG